MRELLALVQIRRFITNRDADMLIELSIKTKCHFQDMMHEQKDIMFADIVIV